MSWIYCLVPKLATKTVFPRFFTVRKKESPLGLSPCCLELDMTDMNTLCCSPGPVPGRGGRDLHGGGQLGARAGHLRHRGIRGQGRHRGGQRGGQVRGDVVSSAANRLIAEVVQSRRRPLLGPSPG